MNIILTGYMGSGKSVIGAELANKLGFKFIDLDTFIEENEQQSISNIFKYKGDVFFRNIETKYLIKILANNNRIVLSLGGGTPCYNNNFEIINSSNNTSFYLKNSNTVISKRLFNEKKLRPIISNISTEKKMLEFVSKHLFEREYYYLKANFLVDCNQKKVDNICDLIILNLK